MICSLSEDTSTLKDMEEFPCFSPKGRYIPLPICKPQYPQLPLNTLLFYST